MSTNKSTEEQLGLVPTHKSACDWFELTLTDNERLDLIRKYNRPTTGYFMDHIWMQEVVKQWFHEWALGSDRAKYDKWCTFLYNYRDGMGLMDDGSDTELAAFYLKEHSVKLDEITKMEQDSKDINDSLRKEASKEIYKIIHDHAKKRVKYYPERTGYTSGWIIKEIVYSHG